jgi:hypothetical protein
MCSEYIPVIFLLTFMQLFYIKFFSMSLSLHPIFIPKSNKFEQYALQFQNWKAYFDIYLKEAFPLNKIGKIFLS